MPESTTVWIVEDNRLLRSNLAELIDEEEGMHCSVAVGSCEAFLAELESAAPPDVVLMDLGLPGRSGIDGIARAHLVAPSTRVIVLTIHEENEKVFEAICAGASGYLLKPSPPSQIVEAIREVKRGGAPINAYIARKMLSMFSQLPGPPSPGPDYGLTPREQQILGLLVEGLIMKQIAARLGVSYHTVGNHLRSIYHKLHVHSRSKAVAKALREDLI